MEIRKQSLVATFLSIFLLLLLLACEENEKTTTLENPFVIINNELYKETTTENYSITNVSTANNTVIITINSSGCDGSSWKVILVDAAEILESNPIQRNIKIALENEEVCDAVIEKEFSFDIQKLKENYDTIILNIKDWNGQITI